MLVSFMKKFRTLYGLCLKHNIVVLNEIDSVDLEYFKEIFLNKLQQYIGKRE